MGRLGQVLGVVGAAQVLIVPVTAVLIVSAVNPSVALPALAAARAEKFLQPSAEPQRNQQSIADETSSNAVMLQQTAVQRKKQMEKLAYAKPDCHAKPCIALTFDDGPSTATTPKVLSILEEKRVAASFFLVGRNVDGNEKLIQRMAADGFEIGNHTWSHPDLRKLKDDEIRKEVLSTQAAIVAAGAPMPTLLRPPYGSWNKRVMKIADLQVALWNEDPRDWDAKNSKQLAKMVLKSVQPGGVVVMHDIHKLTAGALGPVIDKLKDENYQFVTVSELMKQREASQDGKPFYGIHQP